MICHANFVTAALCALLTAKFKVYTKWARSMARDAQLQLQQQTQILASITNMVITTVSIYLAFIAVVYQGVLGVLNVDAQACSLVWSPLSLYAIGAVVSLATVFVLLRRADKTALSVQQLMMKLKLVDEVTMFTSEFQRQALLAAAVLQVRFRIVTFVLIEYAGVNAGVMISAHRIMCYDVAPAKG
jgi:hypothetical protein